MHNVHVGCVVKRSLIDGVLVTEAVARLGRLQMVDELVSASKACARDAAWASIDGAEEA